MRCSRWSSTISTDRSHPPAAASGSHASSISALAAPSLLRPLLPPLVKLSCSSATKSSQVAHRM